MKNDRYFGLHFDFHAGNKVEIGANTNAEDIEWYIKQTNPDYIQCDCKGHPGNSCYPTKVGKAADKLKADNLKVWVDTVHAKKIPIYVHYSGVMDAEYIKSHPETAAYDEDGTTTGLCTSVFSNYVDDLLIPQLKELINDYNIDGVWVDGDNWAVYRDYSDNAKPYLYEGITYSEHNKIMREGFMQYVKKYVDEIHQFKPDFKIISNWLYTSQVPERVDIDVDYISGDLDPCDSAYCARFEARCIALQGKPWDIMSWTFGTQYNSYGAISKSAPQLIQEAAVTISQGGGFEMYITQNADGSARHSNTDVYRRVAEFMHKRRFLHNKLPVAQVGILYSAESRYEETAKDPCVYNPPQVSEQLKGAVHAVLDCGYTMNMVLEHQLDKLADYEIIIVPEWKYLPEETEKALLDYAQNGGNLVLIGAALCEKWGKILGKDFGEANYKATPMVIDENDNFIDTFGGVIDLKEGKGGIYSGDKYRNTACRIPLYRTDACGNGTVTFIAYNLASCYKFRKSYVCADLLFDILADLSTPWIQTDRRNIDITLQKDGDDMLLNVINMNQNRNSMDYCVFDEVPSQSEVKIHIARKLTKVESPLGDELTVEYGENHTEITLKKLDIHTVLKIR